MRNLYLFTIIAFLLSACDGNEEIKLTGSIDILNAATIDHSKMSFTIDSKIEGADYIDEIYIRRFDENMVLIDSALFLNGATNAIHTKTVNGFEKGKKYFIQASTHDEKMQKTTSDIINVKIPVFLVSKVYHQNTHLNFDENGVLPNEEIYIEGSGLNGFFADEDREYKILINDVENYANIKSNSDTEITFELGASVVDLFDEFAYCDTLCISIIDDINSGYEYDLRVFNPDIIIDSISILEDQLIRAWGAFGNGSIKFIYFNELQAKSSSSSSHPWRYFHQQHHYLFSPIDEILPGTYDVKLYDYNDNLVYQHENFIVH